MNSRSLLKPTLAGGLFLLGCAILLTAAWCGSTDTVHGVFWYILGVIGTLIATAGGVLLG